MKLTRWGAVPPEPCRDLDDRSPAFTQWWYFDAEFADGHRLMAILQPRMFARVLGEENESVPGLTLVLTDPSSRNYGRRAFFPGELTQDPATGVVCFGQNRLEFSGGQCRLRLELEGVGCDLRWVPRLPPWAPLPGLRGRLAPALIALGQRRWAPSDHFEYASVIPRGHVEGTLRLGAREVPVVGSGYHERGVSNVAMSTFFASWFWARLFVNEWTFVFPVAQAPARLLHLPLRAMLVARGEQILCDQFDATGLLLHHRVRRSERHGPSGREVPRAVSYTARLPDFRLDLDLELFHEREAFQFSAFSGPTPLQPVWLQHLARATVDLRWRGERVRLEGEAVFETMLSGSE